MIGPLAESSGAVRGRVEAARELQEQRGTLNRSLSRVGLDREPFTPDAERLLADSVKEHGLSARAWDRLRRVARTIADLEAADKIGADPLPEALSYRSAP